MHFPCVHATVETWTMSAEDLTPMHDPEAGSVASGDLNELEERLRKEG